MTAMSPAIFLSYASQDAGAAQRIFEALRAGGVEVWFDQGELRGGDAWDRKIRKQIHDCILFIPIISTTTQGRREGYFRREWKLAVDRTHDMSERTPFLVPVVIDATTDSNADVPDAFLAVQWTRLPAGETSPAFVEHVLRLLSPEPPSVQPQVASKSAPRLQQTAASPSTRRPLQPVALIMAAIALIGIGYFALDRLVLSKRSANVMHASPSAAAEKSIAVLPFADMSEKKDQEYFSDGLSEELIDHLAHSPDLKVIARTSSFQFKGKSEDVRSIAGKLGVANLLEGSIRTAGHQMRITAQLIRASDGTDLWSQTYDRQMSDIFKVQDEIADMVVQALNATLALNSKDLSAGAQNTEAHRLLLKGEFFYYRFGEGDNDRALEQYQQALALDPNYSLAWAKIGRMYIIKGLAGDITAAEAQAKARDALRHALALDPNSVVAHRWLGRLYSQFDNDFPAAKKEFDRAIALDPNSFDGKSARADLEAETAFRTGQFGDVIQLAQRDIESDPLDANSQWFLGVMQYYAGHLPEALATRRRLIELAPNFSGAQSDLATSLLLLGRTAEALAAAQKESDELTRLQSLSCAYWTAGRKSDSDAALHELEGKFADVNAFGIATVHSYRGETDAAFEWLDRAYRDGAPAVQTLNAEPLLANLRGDPRYKALLRKVSQPAERLR
jgi:TolB-like protein/Flp pilus assembly protein TadD